MRRAVMTILITLITFDLYASDRTAEQLVASKQKADMTYKQLMEIMGDASAMIHLGILRENKQMVIQGAQMIEEHPAPKERPWDIMQGSDQNSFKESLLAYDKILHTNADRVMDVAAKGDWIAISEAAQELTVSCITCHAVWKEQVK